MKHRDYIWNIFLILETMHINSEVLHTRNTTFISCLVHLNLWEDERRFCSSNSLIFSRIFSYLIIILSNFNMDIDELATPNLFNPWTLTSILDGYSPHI